MASEDRMAEEKGCEPSCCGVGEEGGVEEEIEVVGGAG